MPRWLILSGAGIGLVLLGIWALGGFDALAAQAAQGQRTAQNALARALRALRAGEPGALAGLLGLAFAYGVLHAAGPGHGKVLIGGYGVARRVGLVRLSAIALLSSLAQATTAVLLVYAGVFVLDLTRTRMVGLADGVLSVASHAAIGAIGLWLIWRALRRLRAGAAAQDQHAHDHHHDHHPATANPAHGHPGHVHDHACGHAHGPTLEQVDQARSLRDAALLIAGIAVRPCTGALFLLILTWQMGIDAAGIAGAYAMGLGTACVTLVVAALAVWSREGAVAALSGGRLAQALPLIELGAGLAVTLFAARMLQGAL